MQQRRPLVSIGLPVYNGARYLERAITTILAQDLADLECIVSDNGSSDATPDIARSYAHTDPRVRYVRCDENRGAAWNFNRVFELASGTYFKWVAHDDEHAPTYLSRCVAALEAHPQAVLSHTQTMTIDAGGRLSGLIDESFEVGAEQPHERWRRLLRYDGGCYHVFGVMRAHVLRQTGLIGPFVASDRVLLAELALHGPFVGVPEPLFLHREHVDRSIYRQPDHRSRELWFDPTRPRLSLPMWKLTAELVRAIGRAPLDWRERMRCRLLMTEWVRRHWLHLLKNPFGAVKHVLSSPRLERLRGVG
ncbi:MAG: glycosyltransferase family 2 protein [Actinomycetota bacterium]|nr:glycosyltransferase family 2 protein [Actinomycetota bacterium]